MLQYFCQIYEHISVSQGKSLVKIAKELFKIFGKKLDKSKKALYVCCMKTKHTQGPWIRKDGSIINYNYTPANGAISTIAQCYVGFDRATTYHEAIANAILITAAPELLDCCKIMLDYLEKKGEGGSVLHTSISLIVKKAEA